jgi:pilus assembly protein CpaE
VEAILRRARPPAEETETHRGSVILFLHGKGGVGATTLAVNTAVALVLGGTYPVAALDLDLTFGNVPLMLNLVPRYTLADLPEESIADADDAAFRQIISDRHESNVWVVAGSDTPERSELVSATVVQQAIERLRTRAEFIVVDAEPSFSEINLAAIDGADLICVVGAPQLPALKATADCLDLLRKLGVADDRVLLVVNRTTPTGLDEKQVALFLNQLNHTADLTVPYTAQCEEAANNGRPFISAFPTNPASREMSDFAAKLMVLAAAAQADEEAG